MLGLELLAHGESDGGLVEGLVGSDRHFDLVAHTQKQQAALGFRQRHLPNDLVKALTEEFLTHWANARFAGLALHNLLVEHLSQTSDVDTGSLLMTHVLNVVLALLDPLSWRQDSVKDVVAACFATL